MSSIDDLCGLYVNAAEQFVRFPSSEKRVLTFTQSADL